jgi:hypothetical protein
MVAHPGQPLERIEGLEVSLERRVHSGAVQDRLVAVEVHELLEGEGVSDEVGGGVLEAQLVLGIDPLTHVRGEAGMSPGEQLPDELLGDGSAPKLGEMDQRQAQASDSSGGVSGSRERSSLSWRSSAPPSSSARTASSRRYGSATRRRSPAST